MKKQNTETNKPAQPTGTRLLTLETIANRWDCSRRYIEGLIKEGVLPVHKMGKRMTRISEVAIEQYEASFLIAGPKACGGGTR